jgi:hypothetical protein
MANPNQILPFATGAAANVLSPEAYAALTALQQGFQNGILLPEDLNSVLRQSSFTAAMVAQFTADYGPAAVNDDGNLVNYEANFVAALHQLFVGIPDCIDVGFANTIVINPTPIATKYAVPQTYLIKVAAVNALIGLNGPVTINVSGLGPKPLVYPSGLQLNAGDLAVGGKILVSYDGLNFQLLSPPTGNNPIPNMVIHYGLDVSTTPNVVVAAVDQTVTYYAPPLWFGIVIANNNTQAATININAIGSLPITRGGGTPLSAGDLVAGTIAFMAYDGVECQLINPQTWAGGAGGGGGGTTLPFWISANSATTVTPPSSPATNDTYLIPTGATGSWIGNVGKVVTWTGTAWVYATYPTGSVVGAADTNRFYNNIGSGWVEVQIPTLGKLFFYFNL